jgi:hypothetical protein
MEVDKGCLSYLTNHSFIRNEAIESFVEENNFSIELEKFIVYCVGNIDGERIVHAIRIKGRSSSPGVTSYLIEWFNVACYPIDSFDCNSLDSVTFWVHSGVALRKNFFLFEDRMCLVKSSFIFDQKRNSYYRLFFLTDFMKINMLSNYNCPIYSSSNKISFSNKRPKKEKDDVSDTKLIKLKKSLRKVMKSCNSFGYIEKTYPRLFKELISVIN